MQRTVEFYEYSNFKILQTGQGDRPNEAYAQLQYRCGGAGLCAGALRVCVWGGRFVLCTRRAVRHARRRLAVRVLRFVSGWALAAARTGAGARARDRPAHSLRNETLTRKPPPTQHIRTNAWDARSLLDKRTPQLDANGKKVKRVTIENGRFLKASGERESRERGETEEMTVASRDTVFRTQLEATQTQKQHTKRKHKRKHDTNNATHRKTGGRRPLAHGRLPPRRAAGVARQGGGARAAGRRQGQGGGGVGGGRGGGGGGRRQRVRERRQGGGRQSPLPLGGVAPLRLAGGRLRP